MKLFSYTTKSAVEEPPEEPPVMGVMGVDIALGESGVDPVPEGLRVTSAPAAGLVIVEKVGSC